MHNGNLDEIKARGNSTFNCSKKSYQIKLEQKTELVDGAGKSKTWILLANVFDESLIRNSISYGLANDIGLAFSPQGTPLNLYINGAYRGSYYLCEKIQLAENRIQLPDYEEDLEDRNNVANYGVEIPDIIPTLIKNTSNTRFNNIRMASYTDMVSPEDITGGYLIEFEGESRLQDEQSYFMTEQGTPFVVKEPSPASADEVSYISTLIQDAEDAIYSSSGYNSKGKHFSEYIDLESFAKYYLIQEMTGNADAFFSSTYIYKAPDANGETSKLYAGPIWDCDLSMDSTENGVHASQYGKLYLATDDKDDAPTHWISQLVTHKEFKEMVQTVFDAAVEPAVQTYLDSTIDVLDRQVEISAQADNVRWSVQKQTGEYPYLNFVYDIGDRDASVERIKTFLSTRLAAFSEADFWINNLPNSYALPDSVTCNRIYGNNAYDTALAILKNSNESKSGKPMVLATGAEYYDALAANPLAGLVDGALMITTPSGLCSQAQEAIKYLEPSRVYIVGGESALTASVYNSVASLVGSSNVERIWGNNAKDTAYKIYKRGDELGEWSDTAVISTTGGFWDALSISAYASSTNSPLFLADASNLSLSSRDMGAIEKNFSNAIVCGGTAVINDSSVVSALRHAGISVNRLAGANAYDTSSEIALWETGNATTSSDIEFAVDDADAFTFQNTAFATGTYFADALSGGIAQAKLMAPLLLLDPNSQTMSESVLNLVQSDIVDKASVSKVRVFGGSAAVPDSILQTVLSGWRVAYMS